MFGSSFQSNGKLQTSFVQSASEIEGKKLAVFVCAKNTTKGARKF